MVSSLRQFGFGSNFIWWIKILYTDPAFHIKNNVWLSMTAYMKRGIRQWCSVSALLFILAVEFLSVQIKRSKNIKGLKLSKHESVILQYADDTTLTLCDQQSITYALEEVSYFSSVSGLKVNAMKSHGIWLRSIFDNPKIFAGIEFSDGYIKCLGIYIGKDKNMCKQKNCINDLELSLLRWNRRNLTYYGKSIVMNTLIIPKLGYNMTVLHVPNDIVKRIKKTNFFFPLGESAQL